MVKVKVGWTDNKDDFVLSIQTSDWIITNDDELMALGDHELRPRNAKHIFTISGNSSVFTTELLRLFCQQHHPEVNFDEDLETDKPGVFARYQERYGHDYEEYAQQQKYDMLNDKLRKLGYALPWED